MPCPSWRHCGRWPSSHIAWVVNRPFQDVLRDHRDLDELIVFDRAGRGIDPLGIGAAASLFQRLRRGRFDLTIDLQGLFRSALMTAATGARVRVGMADAREGARWFYTDRVHAPRLEVHAVERIRRMTRELGADVSEPRFHLPIGSDDLLWAQETLAGVPSPRIVLNLGARWPTKRWPPEHFAEIGRRAVSEYGAGLIAVGSAVDRPFVDRAVAPIPAGLRPRPLRPDHPAPACGDCCRVRPDALQRHRTTASGRGGRRTSRRNLHLHRSHFDRAIRPACLHGSKLRLVRTELPEEVPAARVHG